MTILIVRYFMYGIYVLNDVFVICIFIRIYTVYSFCEGNFRSYVFLCVLNNYVFDMYWCEYSHYSFHYNTLNTIVYWKCIIDILLMYSMCIHMNTFNTCIQNVFIKIHQNTISIHSKYTSNTRFVESEGVLRRIRSRAHHHYSTIKPYYYSTATGNQLPVV